MDNINLDNIPGLKEAVADQERRDQEIRSVAFVPLPIPLCGLMVRQFTPRHYEYLTLAGSPFFVGGAVTPEHILQFFWVVSPEFCTDAPKRDAWTIAAAAVLPTSAEILPEIDRYLEDAWMDKRSSMISRGADRSSIASLAAHLVDEFAAAYSWPDDKTLDTPFAALFQLQRLIDRREAARNGRELRFANRSAKVERDFVDRYIAERGTAVPAVGPAAVSAAPGLIATAAGAIKRFFSK